MIYYSTQLYHHGVEGQKWGKRRYQNEDGSYKPGAEGRYYDDVDGEKGPSKKEKKPMTSAKKRKYAKIALGNSSLAVGTVAGALAFKSSSLKERSGELYDKSRQLMSLARRTNMGKYAAESDTVRRLAGQTMKKAITAKKVAIGTGIAAGVLAAGFGAIKIKELMNKKKKQQAKENKANQASEG